MCREKQFGPHDHESVSQIPCYEGHHIPEITSSTFDVWFGLLRPDQSGRIVTCRASNTIDVTDLRVCPVETLTRLVLDVHLTQDTELGTATQIVLVSESSLNIDMSSLFHVHEECKDLRSFPVRIESYSVLEASSDDLLQAMRNAYVIVSR